MNFDVYKKFDELDNTRNNLQNFLIEAQESLKKFNLDFTPNSYWNLIEGNHNVPIQNSAIGGPFLPEKKTNVVEIANITLASTTGDIFSIRAKKTKNRINYSIVDEYEGTFSLSIKSSQKSLSLKRMIKLIDDTTMDFMDSNYRKLFGGSRASNIEEFDRTTPLSNEDIERIWDFERVYSDFYPELEEWYDIQNFIWLVRKKIEII
tara:strand:+ start:387 stop:1004 length:618 start_codon:yes stop_codon:yes gene_type:complete